jgi:hypothetical protein
MRILILTLAGMLALSTPIVAYAHRPGSEHNAANTTPITHQGGSSSSVSQPAPGVGGWRAAGDRGREWCPPQWRPNHIYGGWGRYGGRAVPTYWVWVPGSAHFDYPFEDPREPFAGWGDP